MSGDKYTPSGAQHGPQWGDSGSGRCSAADALEMKMVLPGIVRCLYLRATKERQALPTSWTTPLSLNVEHGLAQKLADGTHR